MTRRLTAAALAVATLALPGCIAWDIHDQVEGVNTKLVKLDERLQTVEQINDKLESIDTSLKSIDTTLTSVDKTLTSLDAHLAALRKTLQSIDKTIPFLSLGSDEEEPTTAAEQAAAEAGDNAPADQTEPATSPSSPGSP